MTYLDTCIFIYWIEGPAPFDARVRTHLATLQAAGQRFAVSEFTRLECLVKPLGVGDGALLLDYQRIFLAPNVTLVPLDAPVYERAANIRAFMPMRPASATRPRMHCIWRRRSKPVVRLS
jgi:hypothetical protein